MRWILALVLVMLGAGAWGVGQVLSSDAIALLLGVTFGILAGLPPALLMLVASRRREAHSRTQGTLPPPTVVVVQLPDGRKVRALLTDGESEGTRSLSRSSHEAGTW